MKIHFLPLLYAASLLLAGCAGISADDPAVLALAKHDRRSPQAIATDQTIEADIYHDLLDDGELRLRAHVNVNAYDGAVLVTGEVADDAMKNKIIDEVRVTPHVKLVHDHLSIAYPSDAESRAGDAQLNGNLKAALAQIRTLPDFEAAVVKVVTEQAVVYLMGRVHREEGGVVINVVRHQPGVKRIVTLFEYLD